jgi:tetratricopeptide (TPR) repeat protein
MKKILLFFFTSIVLGNSLLAQKDTLTAEQAKELLAKLPFDSIYFLKKAAANTCLCLDSISVYNKSRDSVAKEISACIDREVNSYQLSVKFAEVLKSTTKKNSISLALDKNSNEYKRYYYTIEERLADSCKALRRLMTSNDKMSDKSITEDRLALKTYDKGVDFLKKEEYKEALSLFRKAVELDPEFAFAWDNIGICERKLGNYDAAIAAYKTSLSIDPKGAMPLHNLIYAYEFKKEYDSALIATENLLSIYPNDPEAYYGAGRIYIFFKKDFEKGLDQICKAYNIYVENKSPYRSDAQQNIQYIYTEMKKQGKEEKFKEILKKNKITITD